MSATKENGHVCLSGECFHLTETADPLVTVEVATWGGGEAGKKRENHTSQICQCTAEPEEENYSPGLINCSSSGLLPEWPTWGGEDFLSITSSQVSAWTPHKAKAHTTEVALIRIMNGFIKWALVSRRLTQRFGFPAPIPRTQTPYFVLFRIRWRFANGLYCCVVLVLLFVCKHLLCWL